MNKSVLYSPITTICLLVLVGYLGVSVAQKSVGGQQDSVDQTRLVREVDELTRQKKSLEEELQVVQSDVFVEQEARNKLQLVKPNETIVMYPQESQVLSEMAEVEEVLDEGEAKWPGYIGEWLGVLGMNP